MIFLGVDPEFDFGIVAAFRINERIQIQHRLLQEERIEVDIEEPGNDKTSYIKCLKNNFR